MSTPTTQETPPAIESLLPPLDPAQRRRRLLRRLIPLLFLGAGAGLAISKVAGNVRHEVKVSVRLPPDLDGSLDSLNLAVEQEQVGEPLSYTVFRLDPEHRLGLEIHELLRLQNGRYWLRFTGQRRDGAPFEATRSIEVSGDSSIRLEIP